MLLTMIADCWWLCPCSTALLPAYGSGSAQWFRHNPPKCWNKLISFRAQRREEIPLNASNASLTAHYCRSDGRIDAGELMQIAIATTRLKVIRSKRYCNWADYERRDTNICIWMGRWLDGWMDNWMSSSNSSRLPRGAVRLKAPLFHSSIQQPELLVLIPRNNSLSLNVLSKVAYGLCPQSLCSILHTLFCSINNSLVMLNVAPLRMHSLRCLCRLSRFMLIRFLPFTPSLSRSSISVSSRRLHGSN